MAKRATRMPFWMKDEPAREESDTSGGGGGGGGAATCGGGLPEGRDGEGDDASDVEEVVVEVGVEEEGVGGGGGR